MNLSIALPTFVITLREGVEAALVIGIVLALLKKAQQSRLNPWVYGGIFVGIAASCLIGILFNLGIQTITQAYPEYVSLTEALLKGFFSLFAIVMLSWMLIWMTKQAKSMKGQVEGAVTSAIDNNENAGWGIFSLILIAVVREGFETVLFIASNFHQGISSIFGAIGGLVGATVIGVMLFKLGIKINIRRFFQIMGILLVLIVAGLVVSALKNFDIAIATLAQSNSTYSNLCISNQSCILGPLVWDISGILPDKQFPGVILKSLFGYRDQLFLIQAISYLAFLFTIGGLYLRSISNPGGKLAMAREAKP
jgi:high-affinity iron transporter